MSKITARKQVRQFYYATVANQGLNADKNKMTMVRALKQDFTDENGHFIKKPRPNALIV